MSHVSSPRKYPATVFHSKKSLTSVSHKRPTLEECLQHGLISVLQRKCLTRVSNEHVPRKGQARMSYEILRECLARVSTNISDRRVVPLKRESVYHRLSYVQACFMKVSYNNVKNAVEEWHYFSTGTCLSFMHHFSLWLQVHGHVQRVNEPTKPLSHFRCLFKQLPSTLPILAHGRGVADGSS